MRIYFPNQHKTVEVPAGVRLLDVIQQYFGAVLSTPCGGSGSCGKCTVRLGTGETVRACQMRVTSEMTVFLETASVQDSCAAIVSCFSPRILQRLSSEAASDAAFSLVFDVGTTTLVGALVRKNTILSTVSRLNPQRRFGADVISRIQYGMQSAAAAQELQRVLLEAVCEMTSELFSHEELHSNSGANIISSLVFSGNTTMETTLLGLGTASLGAVPFHPSEHLCTEITAGDVRWNGAFSEFFAHPRSPAESESFMESNSFTESEIHAAPGVPFLSPQTPVRIFPVIGGFVGGDITAGILASELETAHRPTFFLDLGTNGEMVLNTGGEKPALIACATAAGPCFEGARISCGMCAETGAVTRIENLNGNFSFKTFRNAPVRGICGSALIDLTAELLRLRLLTPDGRLLEPAEIPPEVPSSWACRIQNEQNPETSFFEPVFRITENCGITQSDFRELQLAVGAIRTGIQLLLRRGGVSVSDLSSFQTAGGFGRNISIQNAQRIGLIPAEIAAENVEFPGNTSLAGGIFAAISDAAWEKAAEIAAGTECRDLALEPGFSDAFMASMFWPETENPGIPFSRKS